MTDQGDRCRDDLFADVPLTPGGHFRIYLYGAVLAFIERLACLFESFEKVFQQFPFLGAYNNELAERLEGLAARDALARWWTALEIWESRAPAHLPLRALRRAAGLDHSTIVWLLTIGLIEEDPRFGALFEALQGTPAQGRPTLGFLRHCWAEDSQAGGHSRPLPALRALGLVQVTNPEAPRHQWVLQVPSLLWDALRGDPPAANAEWARHRPSADLLRLDELVLSSELSETVRRLPTLLEEGEVRLVVVRGPHHNGRHTLLGAVARALGRGLLVLGGFDKPDDERWRQAMTLAMLLNDLPVIEWNLAPGETLPLPSPSPVNGPLGVVLNRQGGLSGPLTAQAVTLTLEMPDAAMRRIHWQRSLAPDDQECLSELPERFRLAAGHIYSAARLARTQARLADRSRVRADDVLEATRTLNRQALDTLARPVPAMSDLSRLCVGERTGRELAHLASRCRRREELSMTLSQLPGGAINCGVRALFTGPSGTGKTLAARLLAGTLRKDLYQFDLSAVVNKYIGETEKNLNRILDLAEELDVILLLDEGDALLTRRTDVQTANDRYANLETNFLLQRLDGFQGVLIVTTNTRQRIDSAFERRLDVVVEFHPPDAEQRWQLWQMHLPAARELEDELLAEVVACCELTGGQIRNAALHAALLALENGGAVTTAYLEAAVRREYAKEGGACPLRAGGG